MEVGIIILGIILAFAFLLDKASDFVKELKSGSARLTNGFEAKLSVIPTDNKKSEACGPYTNFTNDISD